MEYKPIELKDTVDLMLSDDYKSRFVAEYLQLGIRYQKLCTMLDGWDRGVLIFQPTCDREIFNKQLEGMRIYLDVLFERAKIEGIDVPKYK